MAVRVADESFPCAPSSCQEPPGPAYPSLVGVGNVDRATRLTYTRRGRIVVADDSVLRGLTSNRCPMVRQPAVSDAVLDSERDSYRAKS